MSEYMEFFKAGYTETGKTEVYDVLSKSSGAVLGHIKWYGAWRQYCFFPSPNCVFNMGCLNQINEHIKVMMFEHTRMKGKP